MKTYIVSKGRPFNVAKMHDLVGTNVIWVVPACDQTLYSDAGAKQIINSAVGVANARNAALDHAHATGDSCVQLSDDLKGIKFIQQAHGSIKEISVDQAILIMDRELSQTPYKLCGVAPTANAFYFHKPRSTNLFIVGDLIMVRPCKLRFDPTFRTKEDYDYTAQHIREYGGALRLNGILAEFSHRTNSGGVVDIRTIDVEKAMAQKLMEKHPTMFRKHPRRDGEVLLKVRA